MEAEYDPLPSSEQRLPSTRPIDRRWDQSRGILFNNAKRSVSADFTWSRDNGIVFARTPSSRRGYAQRDMFPESRRASEQTPPQGKAARSQNNVLDGSIPIDASDIPSRQVLDRLKQEQVAHKETKKRFESEIEQIRIQKEEEMRQFRERTVGEAAQEKAKGLEAIDTQKKKLVNERERFEEQKREHARKSAEKDQTLKERDQMLKQSENNAKMKEAELDSTIANAIKKADEIAQQAASDAERYQREYDEKWHKLVSDNNEELREYKSTLNQLTAQKVVPEMREWWEGGLYRRQIDRKDYESYHQVWDEIGHSMRAYSEEISTICRRLSGNVERWKGAAQSFDRWKKDRWFPHTYPELDRKLGNFLHISAEETEKSLKTLEDLKNSAYDALRDLSREAHVSRSLTRYHQFEAINNKYTDTTLVSSILNEAPINTFKASIDRQIEQIKRELEATTLESTKEALQQRLQLAKSERTVLSKILTFYICFRESEGLEALRRDAVSEKAIFLVTQKARELLEQARSDWSSYTTENPGVSFDSEVSPEEQERDRSGFLDKYRVARDERNKLSNLIRKRHLLEMYLEETKDNEAEYDAAIDKELARAESAKRDSLRRLIIGSRVRQLPIIRAPSISPVTLPSPVEAERRRLEVETELRSIRAKQRNPNSYETEEDKDSDALRMKELRLKYHRLQITALTGKRAEIQRKSPNDHAATLRLQNAIEGHSKAIERAERETQPLRENTNMDVMESNASESDAAKPATPKPRRARLSVRKLKSGGGRGSGKRIAPTAFEPSDSSENSTGTPPASTEDGKERSAASGVKFVNFKATSGQQAPHSYWSDNIRSLHSESAKQNNAPASSISDSSPRSPSSSFEDAMPLVQALRRLSLGSAHAKDSSVHVDADASRLSNHVSEHDNSFGIPLDHEEFHYTPRISQIADAEVSSRYPSISDHPYEIDSSPDWASTMRSEDSVATSSEAGYDEAAEPDVDLTYKIPSNDYRNAVIASKNTAAAFWNFKLYKNADGKYPKVLYCVNYETSEARAKDFLNESIIGFDMEWEPWAAMAKSSPKHNVSLIQIAAEDKIGLFHLAMFNGETPDKLMPPSLRAILESRNITKAGVNVAGDANRLRQCLNVEMKGLFELSHLYRVVELSQSAPAQVNKRLVKLAEQVQSILGLPLKKDAVQTSAWSKKLHMEQTDYAASDAYAGYHLYKALESKRKKMNPMPPRPAFWEEHQPLQLGNGRLIYPSKTQPSKRKREDPEEGLGGVIEADDDECEEFFDAADGLDADPVDSSPSSLESSQRSGSSSGSYVSLQSEGDSQDADVAVHSQDQDLSQPLLSSQSDEPLTTTSHPTAKRTQRQAAHSAAIDRAETWATNWRASLPTGYNLTARPAELRAYHMWYEQRLDCEEVAALLNITTRTVGSYVMQALKHEDLPFDAERVNEPLELLPKSVHGRYRKVLERGG